VATNDKILAWEMDQAELDYHMQCMRSLLANLEAERDALGSLQSIDVDKDEEKD